MDFKTGVPVLEFEFITQFKGTEAVSKGRECEQLANGGQNAPVNNAHRGNEKAPYDERERNEKAHGKSDFADAALLLLAPVLYVL